MCKCAADKHSSPLGKKPTVRWSHKKPKYEGEVDTWVLTFRGSGRRTRLLCWRRGQGKGAAVCPGRRQYIHPPPSKIPAARACREMANSYTGHWVSVQGLMEPQISYGGRCFAENTLRNMYEVTLEWRNITRTSLSWRGFYGSHP